MPHREDGKAVTNIFRLGGVKKEILAEFCCAGLVVDDLILIR